MLLITHIIGSNFINMNDRRQKMCYFIQFRFRSNWGIKKKTPTTKQWDWRGLNGRIMSRRFGTRNAHFIFDWTKFILHIISSRLLCKYNLIVETTPFRSTRSVLYYISKIETSLNYYLHYIARHSYSPLPTNTFIRLIPFSCYQFILNSVPPRKYTTIEQNFSIIFRRSFGQFHRGDLWWNR